METEKTDTLVQVVYLSTASSLPDQASLTQILQASHRNNTADGLTGMLLHHEGNFMQVLEGPEPALRKTLARIADDPRHQNVITLLDRPVPDRSFANWAMAFRGVRDLEGIDPAAASPFLESRNWGVDLAGEAGPAERLLAGFRDRLR